MNKSKLRFNFVVNIIVVLIVLLFCSIMTIFISPNKVFAHSNIGSAVNVGGGAELWNDSSNSFDNYVVADLANKLFGDKNPIKYIKSMKDTLTDSYVVPASIINAKVGNATNGMVVQLGGRQWMVTSLTIADINGKENIVVTLYLANSEGNIVFNNDASLTKGNNAYSNSELRNEILTNSKWDLYTQTGENSFASRYLVKPKYIKYQHNESRIGREGNPYHFPNEALDDFFDNWNIGYTEPYKSTDTFTDPNGVLQRYDAWGEDYIWIPSLTEAGSDDFLNETSIWKLSSNQRKDTTTGETWLRSGHGGGHWNGSYGLKSDGNFSYRTVDANLNIRPAIHLNLTQIFSEIANTLENPEDLASTYNTEEQKLSEIALLKDNTHWYDKNLYETENEYVTITYIDGKSFENAGEYWIKAEIKESWIKKVNQEIDNDIANHNWTAQQIEVVREFRRAKFRDEADTGDSEHLESDTVRWFKVTIEQAEIDFSQVKWSADKLEYNTLNQTVRIIEGLPSFVTVKYSEYSKKEVGIYTAQVIEMTCSDSNYKVPADTELANYPTLKHTWEITKKKIVANWKYEGVSQDGITIAKPVLNVDKSILNSIEYTYYKDSNMTQKITLDEIFAEFDITVIKTYWVKATFKSTGDYNNDSCIFVYNGVESTELQKTMETGSTSNSVKVEIVNNKVTFNGSEQIANFSVSGGGLTEDDLVLEYRKQDGTILSSAPTNAGIYKVIVSLKDELTDFIITSQTEFDFEIESLKVTKPRPNQTQYFDADGFNLSDIANLPKDWKNYFDIKAYDKDNKEIFPQNDSWKFANVNVYRIEIIFKNGTNTNNGSSSDNVIWSDGSKDLFTVSLEIKPLEFVVQGWSESTGNKKPVLTGADSAEIEKYFDYIIYELKNGVIVGNMLPQNATLKYSTDYQISLKVKDEFKGNVFLDYNGNKIDETETFKFKTDINPNPGSDEDNGEDGNSDGNNGNGANSGTELWFGTNGKLPIFAWILVGIVLLLFVVLILVLILKRDRKQPLPQQPIPYAHYYYEEKKEDTTNSDKPIAKEEEPVRNVRGTIVNNYKVGYKDWTFVIKETDVLNLDALESPQDEVMFYVFNKNDLRKVKKLQNQIDLANNETNLNSKEDMPAADKKNKKHKGRK